MRCDSVLFCLLAAVLMLGVGSSARAQDDERSTQARVLFREGLAFADHGDWERAVERFRRALDLRASAPIRYNLAQSLVHMGRLVEARAEIDLALRDPNVQPDVRASAERLLGEIAPRLGELTVEVHGNAPDLSVTVDGRPLAADAIGRPTPTDPGVRVARLLRGDEELDIEEVDVAPGGRAHVVLDVPVLGRNGRPIVPVAQDEGWIWGIGIGAALVAIGAAIVIAFVLTDTSGQPSMGDFIPPFLEID